MSVRSMTGFAQVRRTVEQGEIVCSLKSVNHRGLDLHFHLPPELDAMENDIRGVIKSGVARGHLQIQLALTRLSGSAAGLNRPLLALYLNAFREAAELLGAGCGATGGANSGASGQQPDLNAAL